jgi:hypothetical protein
MMHGVNMKTSTGYSARQIILQSKWLLPSQVGSISVESKKTWFRCIKRMLAKKNAAFTGRLH